MDVKYHIPEAYRNHYDPEKPESLARYPQQVNLIPPSLQPPKKEVIAESKGFPYLPSLPCQHVTLIFA